MRKIFWFGMYGGALTFVLPLGEPIQIGGLVVGIAAAFLGGIFGPPKQTLV